MAKTLFIQNLALSVSNSVVERWRAEYILLWLYCLHQTPSGSSGMSVVDSMVLYPEIQDAFITAAKKAMETHHYEVRAPEISFMCPDQSGRCSKSPHPATLDDRQSCLKCSLKPGRVSHPLSEDQKMWLTSGVGT